MRILLVRIFLLCFFTLPYLTYTYRYLPKVVSEKEKRKKNRCLGLIFPISFFFLIPSQA